MPAHVRFGGLSWGQLIGLSEGTLELRCPKVAGGPVWARGPGALGALGLSCAGKATPSQAPNSVTTEQGEREGLRSSRHFPCMVPWEAGPSWTPVLVLP